MNSYTHPQGVSIVAYWKAKLPLAEVLNGGIDGRTISGGRQALRRLTNPQRKQPLEQNMKIQVGLLSNYMSAVTIAQSLQAANIANVNDKDLQASLATMEQNGVEFPLDVQKALLVRRLVNASTSTDYMTLMAVINPFVSQRFDPFKPTVGGLSASAEIKLASFQQVVFTEMMIELVGKGEVAKDRVVHLAKSAKSILDDVDVVTLSNEAAQAVEDSSTICDALIGLVTDTLDQKYQAGTSFREISSERAAIKPMIFHYLGEGLDTHQPLDDWLWLKHHYMVSPAGALLANKIHKGLSILPPSIIATVEPRPCRRGRRFLEQIGESPMRGM